MPRLISSLFALSPGRGRPCPTTVLPPPRPGQPLSSIPTHIKDVKAQETEPRRLPGRDATVEHMRIFIYDLLCYKGYGIVQKWPQWILETVAVWNLAGAELRDYAGDWDILCPATGGHAPLNSNCKFTLLSEGDCRRGIGRVIEDTVNKFKAQEAAAQRQRDDWNKMLAGNPPPRRNWTRGYSASIAGYPSAASVRSYAPSNYAGSTGLGSHHPLMPLQEPGYYPQPMTNFYPSHSMNGYLTNNQYAPSVAHTAPLAVPRRSSYPMQYASSSRGTPVSRTTTASARSPSTTQTSCAGSLFDGASSPIGNRPCVAAPASLYHQAQSQLTEENLSRTPAQISFVQENVLRNGVVFPAPRRHSYQSLRGPRGPMSSAHTVVGIETERREQLPPRPLSAQNRSRRGLGPPPVSANIPYTHTQGMRHNRTQSAAEVRSYNSAVMMAATEPNPALSRCSSVDSVSELPPLDENQEQLPTFRDPLRRKTVGGNSIDLPPRTEPPCAPKHTRSISQMNPYPHATPHAQFPPFTQPHRLNTPPAPIHPDIISATPIAETTLKVRPRSSAQSLLRSFTSPFRSKKTASTDEFALAQGRYIVYRAGDTQERNEAGRPGMMSGWAKGEKAARDAQGPCLRRKDPRTGGPAQTLVESIEIVESMKTRRRLRK